MVSHEPGGVSLSTPPTHNLPVGLVVETCSVKVPVVLAKFSSISVALSVKNGGAVVNLALGFGTSNRLPEVRRRTLLNADRISKSDRGKVSEGVWIWATVIATRSLPSLLDLDNYSLLMSLDAERTSAPIAASQYSAHHVDFDEEAENQSLLSKSTDTKCEAYPISEGDGLPISTRRTSCKKDKCSSRNFLTLGGTFLAGILITLGVQHVFFTGHKRNYTRPLSGGEEYSDSLASSTFRFPPASPTNWFPDLFPTNVGYGGPTLTGNEAGVIATAPAFPVHTNTPNLVGPTAIKGGKTAGFDVFKHWGNLSPWYSVPSFGLDTTADAPETCRITGLHYLHRHGARYPTISDSYGSPHKFGDKMKGAKLHSKVSGSGKLSFLNDWAYQLGDELLTPFGRQQMYDLGVSARIKYGFLLNNFTDTLPVFRTESQDRMLHSALNFAIGFFGYPIEGQYQQSITYETPRVNNTLAPYMTCQNANHEHKSNQGTQFVEAWTNIYLAAALERIKPQVKGIKLTVEDMYSFQMTCAYETVALGYSKFCELFTEEEWLGFEYALDLYFWYNSGFGSPVARVQGIGYIQELVARLTHTPISVHNSSTNATLDDNPTTFPLHNSLYVDATHEVVVVNIITALNLSNFAASGPLPYDHIPANLSFISSQLAPFGTHIEFQLLSCESVPEPQIRIVINDGVSPLTGIEGCPEQKDGMCPVSTFVKAQKRIIAETDWEWDCYGDWEVVPGWNTTTGDAPKKSEWPPSSPKRA